LHARRIPPQARPRASFTTAAARRTWGAIPPDGQTTAARATDRPAAAPHPAAPARPVLDREGLRRTGSALLSAVIPGLGQFANGRRRLGLAMLLPTLAIVIVAAGILRSADRARLLAWVVDPAVLHALIALSLALLALRLVSVAQAFFDARHAGRPGIVAIAFLVFTMAVVAAPHLIAQRYAGAAEQAFGRFFSGSAAGTSLAIAPAETERVNILFVGIDRTVGRTATLTDSMMLASLDRTLGTVTLISLPRDLVNVPLGDGRIYSPKLNSLYSYANRTPGEFPKGGMRTLEDAVGALLGVTVNYYAELDFSAFVRAVDLAGGVDVNVARAIDDPQYPGYLGGPRGFTISTGPHHLDGVTALAYARSRYGIGDSDFTRAARQQEIVLALKQKLSAGGSLFFRLPELLAVFGDTVRTDLPPSKLPGLAAIADKIDATKIVRVVLQKPLVHGQNLPPLGSVQVPNIAKIQALAARILPPPGTPVTTPPNALPAALATEGP
jgi:LCP family protein required for cell wall assembly